MSAMVFKEQPICNCPKTACRFALVSFLFVLVAGNASCRSQREAKSADRTSGSAKKKVEEPALEAKAKTKAVAPPILIDAPTFELTDQFGNAFGTKDLAGRTWVVSFIFTRCAATCPKQTATFAELQKQISRWPDAARALLVNITVDPEYDDPNRLLEYGKQFEADPERWKFLTGERSEIVRISKDGFKLPVSEDDDPSVPITHSARFILVDSHGKIRGFYDGLSDEEVRKLLGDWRYVLSEPGQNTTDTVHVGVPREVFSPPWLEARQAQQLATRGKIGVFHDFQFEDQLDASGIRFVSRAVADATITFEMAHYDHANGIVAADVDGDGLHDLYFLSQVGGNELWRNLGEGRFEDVTESAGVALKGRVSVSASFADTDNDGDPDLYVTTTRHGNAFFENDGKGHFHDRTKEAGLEYSGHSSGADFFDYDRDGNLDLFLTNVGKFTTDEIGYTGDASQGENPYYRSMKDAFAGHLFEQKNEPSVLYHNEGNNQFVDVSVRIGLADPGWNGDATPMDINQDGWIDLYVLNMQGNDRCYINQQGERFVPQTDKLFPQSVWGGMGVKSFDFDNDGSMDLFVTNMHADMWEFREDVEVEWEKLRAAKNKIPPQSYLKGRLNRSANIFGNALYVRGEDGSYRDVALGVNAENYWPWGLSTGDLNADGFQDVFITSCMNYPYRYHVNSLLLNDRGETFQDAEFILGVEPRKDGKTAAHWFDLDASGKDKDHEHAVNRSGKVSIWGAIGSRSSVIFDLDQDGDLDIVSNDFHTPPMVLRSNLSDRKRDMHYVKVQLRGTRSNRDGLGSRVQVDAGGKSFTQVHDGQSGYLSQSSLPLYFGLGDSASIEKITVQWPGGATQVLSGPIDANQQIVVEETAVVNAAAAQ